MAFAHKLVVTIDAAALDLTSVSSVVAASSQWLADVTSGVATTRTEVQVSQTVLIYVSLPTASASDPAGREAVRAAAEAAACDGLEVACTVTLDGSTARRRLHARTHALARAPRRLAGAAGTTQLELSVERTFSDAAATNVSSAAALPGLVMQRVQVDVGVQATLDGAELSAVSVELIIEQLGGAAESEALSATLGDGGGGAALSTALVTSLALDPGAVNVTAPVTIFPPAPPPPPPPAPPTVPPPTSPPPRSPPSRPPAPPPQSPSPQAPAGAGLPIELTAMIAIACAAGVGLTLMLAASLFICNRRKQKVRATDATQSSLPWHLAARTPSSPPWHLVTHTPFSRQVHDQQMVAQLQRMRTAVLRVEQAQLPQSSDPVQMQATPDSAPPSGLRCRPPAFMSRGHARTPPSVCAPLTSSHATYSAHARTRTPAKPAHPNTPTALSPHRLAPALAQRARGGTAAGRRDRVP